jgi:hypothetical protein
MTQKRVALSVGAVLLLVVAGIFLIKNDDPGESARSIPRSGARWGQLARSGNRQLRTAHGQDWPFASFRGKGREMPRSMHRAVRETIGKGQPLHLDFGNAYLIRMATGVKVWVVRGKSVVCIVRDVKASIACDTSVNAARHGLVLGTYRIGPPPQRKPTQFLMLGIAPDWARAVRIKVRYGPARTVPVSKNAFSFLSKSPIRVDAMIR